MTALRTKADPGHVPRVITATIAADENNVNVRISDQGRLTYLNLTDPWQPLTPLNTLGGGLLLPENQHPSNLFSFSHLRNAARMNEDRLSALHQMTRCGFPITIGDQVTLWRAGQQQQFEKRRSQSQDANASSEEEKGINRMGLGLPLSNTYARYFGGSLDLVSLDGWGESHTFRFPITRFMDAIELSCCLLVLTHYFVPGVDVYLRLPRLGTNLESIEI